jgi:hypothetical protein
MPGEVIAKVRFLTVTFSALSSGVPGVGQVLDLVLLLALDNFELDVDVRLRAARTYSFLEFFS